MAKKSGDCVRVLLAASSPSDARLLCESLREYRLRTFDVEPAACLTDAMAMAAKGPFDVAVLDLKLPDSHGLETCEKMRRAAPDVPIVVLAGTDEEPVAIKATRQGIQDYLIKSQTHGGTLGRAVHYAVERHRAQRTLRDAQEHLQAQAEELRANETLLRSFFDGPGVMRGIVDAVDGDILYVSCNPAAASFYDSTPQAVCGKFASRLGMEPEALRSWVDYLEESRRTSQAVTFEALHRIDRREMWLSATVSHLGTDRAGHPRFAFVLLDITERKHTEESLRQANERHQRQADELQVQTEELQAQQEELQSQAEELRATEQALRRLNEELEHRIAARTADLSKANEALRQAGAYTRSLIEASLDPLVTIGPDGRITDVNAATETVTGRTRKQLIGTDFSHYFTEPVKAQAGYQQVFQEGFVRDYPLEIRHKSGRVTGVLYNATVYRDEAGNTLGVFAAARDVTELRRAEQMQARLAAIVEFSDDAIISKDLTGKITSWNKGAEKIYGYTAEEVIGRPISLLTPGGSREETDRILAQLRRDGVLEHYETARITKDGRSIHVSLTVSPIRDATGRVIGASTIARDITERKRAEEAVRRAGAYNRSLIEASLDPLVTIGPDGKITDVNAATEAATGYVRKELIGTDFCDYFTDPAQARAGYRQVFQEGFVRDYPLKIRHKNGRVTAVLYNATVYRDGVGNTVGVFAAARDVTELRRAEESVRMERQRLKDVLEMLPVYVVLLTPDHRVPFANRFFRDCFGESGGKRCFEYLFGRTEPCEPCDTYKVLETHAPHHWEWTGPDARNYDIYDFPFTDTDGSSLIMEMGIDITERKQAEAALRRHQEHLEDLVRERTVELESKNAQLTTEITERERAEQALKEANERLQTQSQQLAAANEELQVVNEELLAQEQELEKSLDAERRTGERFRLLSDTAASLLAAEEPQGIIEGLCGKVMEFLDCQAFFNFLVDPKAGRLRLNACAGIPKKDHKKIEWLDLGTADCGCVARDGQRIVADHIPDSADERTALVKSYGIKAYGCHPIMVGTQVLGTLSFGTKTREVFTEEELSLMKVVTDMVAIAVQRQQGQQALRDREAELRQLNEQLEEVVGQRTEQLTVTIDRLQNEVVRRVLAEGKLRKNSQMLEGFFQHTITPLAFLDRRFNFVRVNDAYARADGKDPQHFVGKNHFHLYPHDENRAIFEQVVRTKKPYRAYARSFAYPHDPKRPTFWNWQLTPLLNDAGEVESLVLNLEDVTEQQRAYEELKQRTRQLQHLALELSQAEDRERKRLAEILHDDLQQILAAAKFHLGILSNRLKNDEPAQEMVGQLNQLLREAIDKSRSLSHELSPAALYQSDLGETFEWLAQQLHTKHGLAVRVETRGRVDSGSEALKAFLYRSAQEMLFNVVKHAKVHEARLRLKRARGQLWLSIHDQGQGFDLKALGKAAGFGLLSIRERVELLGGRMKIRSVPNRGSAFLIAVPDPLEAQTVTQVDLHAARERRERAEAKSPERLRVLLVDDHKVMREGLATLLNEQRDMEVIGQAGNGREAVDLAHKLVPDVIIMDAAMPVMAGDEATRQIKVHLPGIRVIGLSMFDEPQMSKKMRRAGAEAYLLKTVPSDELLTAIRGAHAGE